MPRAPRSVVTAAVIAVVALACSDDGAAPVSRIPARVEAVTTPAPTVQAGAVAGSFAVRVENQGGGALSGIVVTFSASTGGGRVSPIVDTTDVDGVASTTFSASTTPGSNVVSALVAGLPPVRFSVTGTIGVTRTVTVGQRTLRFDPLTDSLVVAATARDTFANGTNAPIAWISRDPTLVDATSAQSNTAIVRVLRRPGQTYVVASSGTGIDSVRVAVLDAASSPCAFIAPPVTLAIGSTVPIDGGAACVHATEAGSQYALVAHYNTAIARVTSRIQVIAHGITLAPGAFPSPTQPAPQLVNDASGDRDAAFELELRRRESREIAAHVSSARSWFDARGRMAAVTAAGTNAVPANVRPGDVVNVNVNAFAFCADPELIGARVVAITSGTVVLADTANPAGGFTEAEYHSFGVTMDTLVNPVDTAAFGAPSDIDGNKRVVILFTKAVNELTPRGVPGGIVLGFYYIRDLLPSESSLGGCPGSNVSEMFYLLAPDPNGQFSDVRTKSDVQRTTMGTIAHEYQHLINASRRMYITRAPQVDEEVWLNEGLSHIAEELVFFRASGRGARQNIDGSQLPLGSSTRALFDEYLLGNFRRYRQYLLGPEGTSPLSADDQLTTRGASWSFLRYVADRSGASDGDLWRRLVDSRLTGAPNLDAALSSRGLATLPALADWSVSVITDDNPSGTSPAFQQPSWNFISAMPATGVSSAFPLATRLLEDRQTDIVQLQGGGSAYLRFVVPENQEALIQVTGAGGALPPTGVRLSVVRIK